MFDREHNSKSRDITPTTPNCPISVGYHLAAFMFLPTLSFLIHQVMSYSLGVHTNQLGYLGDTLNEML